MHNINLSLTSWKAMLILFLSTILLVGCFGDGDEEGNAALEDWDAIEEFDELNEDAILADPENITIKILYYDPERYFMERYGNDILAEFDYIDLELVFMSFYDIDSSVIEEQNIDILFPGSYYHEWANEGHFVPLEMYMSDTYLNVNPDLVELLKSTEDGKIYGLAPTFEGTALLYNPEIFDQYAIEYPRDNMSWKEVFDLASRFPTSEMIGLNYNRISSLPNLIARTNHLDLIDSSGTELLIGQDEAWKEIIELVTTAEKDGYLRDDREEFSNHRYLFNNGEAAMTLISSYILELNHPNGLDVEWRAVTEPVHLNNPTEASSIFPHDLAAISTYSNQQEQAWEIIRFLNSETYAQVLEQKHPYMLVANSSTLSEEKKPFFALTPTGDFTRGPSSLPIDWQSAYYSLLREVMEAIAKEEITLEDGLYKLQSEGQSLFRE